MGLVKKNSLVRSIWSSRFWRAWIVFWVLFAVICILYGIRVIK